MESSRSSGCNQRFLDTAGDQTGASKDTRMEMARTADVAPARTRAAFENRFAIGGDAVEMARTADAADSAETDLECLLDFSLKLGEKLILCGANIERVSDTIQRICESYHCQEVHFFALDCYLTLSLTGADGEMASAQRCVRGSASIHLERLCRLNQLSRDVCAKPPSPKRLAARLEEASDAQSYSPGTTLFFSLLSSAALTGIYDGSLPDLLIILLNMVLINLLGAHLKKWVNNKIIYNVLSAFIIGTVALFFDRVGFLEGYSTVMIVNSLKLVPGVPMVNSLRNLLTGNERNGILELLKLLLETAGIACGFLLSIELGLGGLA